MLIKNCNPSYEIPGVEVIDEYGEKWTLSHIERRFYCLWSRDTMRVDHVTLRRYKELIQLKEGSVK